VKYDLLPFHESMHESRIADIPSHELQLAARGKGQIIEPAVAVLPVTGADEGREAIPGAEIHVGIGEEHPGFQVSLIAVDAGGRVAAESVDARSGAIFDGAVEAQPIVVFVAETAADEERVGDRIVLEDEAVAYVGRVRQIVESVIGVHANADIAA